MLGCRIAQHKRWHRLGRGLDAAGVTEMMQRDLRVSRARTARWAGSGSTRLESTKRPCRSF